MKIKCCFKAEKSIPLILVNVAMLFSCVSAPKTVSIGETIKSTFELVEEEPLAITVPETVKSEVHTYFSYLDSAIAKDIEIGSPASLRRAASSIRKSDSLHEENNKVLLWILSNIMQMVWTSERVDWEFTEITENNAYTGAINSAKNGIFDTSTGNVDFLTIILPALVVVKASNVSAFYNQAYEALQKGLEMSPDSVLVNYLLGTLYKKASLSENALFCFEKAAADSMESFQATYAYAECLKDNGKIQQSYDYVLSMLARHPSDVLALKLAANNAYSLKKLDEAEEYISKALQQNSNDLTSVLFRAKILTERKDFIHAASLLDLYSRQDNSSRDYLLLRAQIQLDWNRNTASAVSTIENALKSYPDDVEVQLFAAKLARTLNIEIGGKSVEQYASSVLQKQPDNEIAQQFAVEGYMQSQNWQKAYENSLSVVSRHKNSQEIIFNHIKICLSLKKFDEAWNYASSLYKNSPEDDSVTECYIQVMVESGRSVQALTLINQLIETTRTRLKSFLYYQRSYLQPSEELALSDLRYSLMANPRNGESLFRLYQIYFFKKDYRKAQYYLKQVVSMRPNDSSLRVLNDELTSLIK